MKIQQMSDRPVYVLNEIKSGECFYFKDREAEGLYIKGYDDEDKAYVINLLTGRVYDYCSFNSLVEPVKASVQIEP